MNGNKIRNYIMIVLFMAFVGYYAIFISFTKDQVSTEAEKRELNQMPELSARNYVNIATEFTAFMKDYISYRQKVTQVYNDCMVNAFQTPKEAAVIIGKEGWLFYNSNAKDPETNEVIDYSGIEYYTTEQMERVAQEVRAADEFCRAHGAKMIFLIAPNKSSVYGRYMPKSYKQVNEVNRADKLYEYLCENTEAIVVYPKKELKEIGKKKKIYFTNDTHWNGMGGFYASTILTEKLGLAYPTLDEVELVEELSAEDLKYMMGVSEYSPDVGNQTPNYSEVYPYHLINSWESMDSYESENRNGKKMLLLGDSFSEELVPALAIAVERLDASRTRYYQFTESNDYDYVIYEMVERNIAIIAQ